MLKLVNQTLRAAAVSCLLFLLAACGSGVKSIPAPALSITTASLPSGTVGVAYSASVAAASGVSPYTFSSSTPPAGLTFSFAGVLSGTPTTAGTSSLAVTVTDSAGKTASATFAIVIAPAPVPLALGPATLPTALAGTAYTTTLQVTGGTTPYTLAQTAGTLPTGFTLTAAGVLSGTAPTAGTYTFTAKATDSSSPQQTVSTAFTLNVVNAAVTINTGSVITTVPQTFFGVHTSVYDGSLDDTARLPALLATSGITTLRYPGGSYADRYHWAQSSLTPLYASTPGACAAALAPGAQVFEGTIAPGTNFGSFVQTLAVTGAQGLITINYGTSVANSTASLMAGNAGVPNRCSDPDNLPGQPQEAAAWVAYANGSATSTQSTQVIGPDATGFDWKTVGFWAALRGASPLATDDGYNFLRIAHPAPIGIKYWEVGNEMYYNGWAGNRNYEADLHAPYIYPGGYASTNGYLSRDSLPALSPTAYGTNAIPFIQAMKAVDPTILVGIDFASPGATDPIPLNWNPDLSSAACLAGSFDLAIIHYYPGTYNAVQPGELLSLPQSDLPRQVAGIQANLKANCSNASAIKFWLTETSPNGVLAANFPTQVTGLFALNEYLTSLQTGILNIDWLELHNGTFLSSDGNETPGPAYFGIELAHLLAAPGDSVVTATSNIASVISYATLKANGQKGVVLINADPAHPVSVQVSVTGSILGSSATQYSYGVSTTQSGTALTGTALNIPANSFSVTVPAYTALTLLIQ